MAVSPERTVSLPDEEQPQERFIDLNDDATFSHVISQDAAEQKALKTHFALGETSPGLDILRADFNETLGRETARQAALAEASKLETVRLQLIQGFMQDAQVTGQQFTLEDNETIAALSAEQLQDPDVILEKLYAKKLIETAVSFNDPQVDPILQDAMEEDEEWAHRILDAGEDLITHQEIAIGEYEQLKKQYDETGWVDWGIDTVTGMFPLVTHMNTTDNPFQATGENISDQVRSLLYLPPKEFKQELKRILKERAEDNIVDALKFAQNVIGYTRMDRTFDNTLLGMDLVDVGTMGAGTALGLLARRTRAVAQANATRQMNVQSGLVAAGNIPAAAVQIVSTNVAKQAGGSQVLRNIQELGRTVPSILDGSLAGRDPGSLAQESVRRITDHITSRQDRMLEVFNDSTVLMRYSDTAQDAALDSARRMWLKDYHKLEDAIVEVVPVRESDEIFGGVDRIDILLGHLDASGFADAQRAEWIAKNLYRIPSKAFDVIERDGNFFIRMSQFVDENQLQILDMRTITDNPLTQTPITEFIGYLGKRLSTVASPDDVFEEGHNQARKIATFGGNRVSGIFKDVATDIGSMSKASRNALEKVLIRDHYRMRQVTKPDGTIENVRGDRYETIGDLQRGWQKVNGQLPSEQEMKAYFTFQTIMDADWIMRNVTKYRDKTRIGITEKSIRFRQKNAQGQDSYMASPFFEAREIDKLPSWGSKTQFTVAYLDEATGKLNFSLSSKLYKKQRDTIESMLASGNFRVLQTVDGARELKDLIKTFGEPIDYLVVRDVKSQPINPIQIEHRPGGHAKYADHGVYLKQPNVNYTADRVIKSGDITAHWDPSAITMAKWHKAYETGRNMIRDGVSAKDINNFIKANLPYKNGRTFTRLFRGAQGAPSDAPFDLNSPFLVVAPGQSTSEVADLPLHYGRQFVDMATSEHNLGHKISNVYGQDRSELLTVIRQEGTDANPVFKFEPAPMLNPLDTISRSSQQLVRSRYYDDYRHRVVEVWGRKYEGLLQQSHEQVYANPMDALVNPQWHKNITDGATLQKAKAERRAILQLMGEEQPFFDDFKISLQTTYDQIAKRAGVKAEKLIDSWRWLDPNVPVTQYLRSVAFHAYLGMYQVYQLGLQGQAVMHMAAITGNPIRAGQAASSYLLVRAGLMSHPNKLPALAKTASKALGIREDQFIEMFNLYRRSGMPEFKGENAMLDTYYKPRIVTSKGHKVLDGMTFFFREGNLLARGASFNAAYLEYRAKNPTKKITDRELAKIVERADLMSINQTRASINPVYETGPAKFATQFFTFQNRLSDQLLGTRLTPLEKARVMGMYSVMYGVPAGVGGTALGRFWPFYEHAQEVAQAEGYDRPEDTWLRFFLEGGLPELVEGITGERFDASGRWGPGGLDWLREVTSGNTGLSDVLFGAAGSFWGEALRTTEPFTMYLLDVFRPADERREITDNDFYSILRNIGSANTAYGLWMAYQHQLVMTKRGKVVGPVEFDAALVTALTGWSTEEVATHWKRMSVQKNRKEYVQGVVSLAMEDFRKGIFEFLHNKNREEGDKHMRRAQIMLERSGLDPIEMKNVYDRAMRENQNDIDRLGSDFIGDMPYEDRDKLFDRRIKELNRNYKIEEDE